MIRIPFGKKIAVEPPNAAADIVIVFKPDGVLFRQEPVGDDLTSYPDRFGAKDDLARFLAQLEEEGFAVQSNGGVFLEWADVFRVKSSTGHGNSYDLLGLPPVESWRPVLESQGTLIDNDFAIVLSDWEDSEGRRPSGNATVTGALFTVGGSRCLLSRPAWETLEAVSLFHKKKSGESYVASADQNRRAWASIRAKAIDAQSNLSDFLLKTVVVTPERLDIALRKGDSIGNRLVEVIPGFAGAPRRWIEIFDRLDSVQERYQIPDGEGLTHVLISPEVGTVLREVKRMPGRRIAGDRAEAFLRNPFAALGPDAGSVVDPDQFEKARDAAGISFARFTSRVRRDESGYPYETGLLIEESLRGEVRGEEIKFEGSVELSEFLAKLESRILSGAQCCHWKGFDLEILGDTPDQATALRSALDQMTRPRGYKASELLDLSRYSERVEGFGVEKPYYSPFIAKKNEDGGWFPDNVEFGVCFTPEGGGETIGIALTEETLGDFREAASKAKEEKRETFSFPGCPKPVSVDWASDILQTIGDAEASVSKGTFDPQEIKSKGKGVERKGLVVKPNVDVLDYEERRGALAPSEDFLPTLPRALRSDIELKDHQKIGVGWLQNLWSKSPESCRGALLADDMGLGKTIQLLAFMASVLESNPQADPFLVVAPVSLLDNWKEEVGKFFEPNTFPLLTLYGPDLASKRLPRKSVEDDLAGEGITRLLRRDWIGSAKVVLTTYETLRDLEFSLAGQKWSAMICDEAQKIKNPNAMVSRAAKKQNARFKIACTGTPVENTLTDLWCLFDFIQPGLLGALKDFGERYRKPIEAETEEEQARVRELWDMVVPQLLRRTKAEVAKDLPKKIEVPHCRSLQISDRQRALYADAIGTFHRRTGSGSGIQSHLGLLQYLRRLCSDPRHPGGLASESVPLAVTEQHSPKMAWLMKQLESIREAGEKAIVFCEFRDLQRVLQRAITERFGFSPDVINGDTSAASANANNRQKRLKAFQEKPGFGAIVLSPLAVGFGVNIQAANHVIHFTRTWNPAKEDQATDRAYRIGQTKDVFVYYPVVVADDFLTFDAKLDLLLEWKRGLSTDILNGTGDLRPSDFGDLGSPGGGSAFGNEALTPEDLESLDPDAFEALCALLWSKNGFANTIRTPKSGDGGVDVVAISGKSGVLIQCKSSSVDGRELGWEAVKDVVAGSAGYAAKYPGVSFSLVAATNRKFNGTARSQARINHVELLDGDDLASRLIQNPVRKEELASFLFSGWGGN